MTLRHLLLGVTLFFLGVVATGGATQSDTPKFRGNSTSNLHLSFQPYAGAGHEDMPVEVLKVVVTVAWDGTGMWVNEWRLKNRSDKNVKRIRCALFVYNADDPTKLLLRHQLAPSQSFHFKSDGLDDRVAISVNEIWPRQKCAGLWCPGEFLMQSPYDLLHPNRIKSLSPFDLLKPLAQDGKIEGTYIIALGIDRVTFSDGTVWEFEAAKDN